MKNHRIRTILAASVALLAISPYANAASTGSSSAFGESVKLNLLPILGSPIQVSSGPLPFVSGAAPPSYSSSNQVASINVSLPPLVQVQTELLKVDAASGLPNANSASSDATVDYTKITVAGLINLTADIIQSKADSSGGCGALSSAGSTVLTNVQLNGLTVAVAPAPNTVLLNVGGVKVVLNEQIVTGSGTTTSITVNAIHISLHNALVGLGLISGDIIISQSEASLHCTPGTADLAVTKIATPNGVALGQTMTYSAFTTNNGPDTATGVTLSDTLPSGVSFVSVSTTQGSCSGTTSITCNLGTIPVGSSVRVDIVVTRTGTDVANTVTVRGNEVDPNPANNTSTVRPPI